jgi:molybdopterin/thiamine biosynthesis adenylyltransferase
MAKAKPKVIKVNMPGVEAFELEYTKEEDLENKISERLDIEKKFTNFIYKRSGKEVIVDYLWARQRIQIGREGQSKLRGGRCVVVGVGALGNELVRNLVLMGIGHITLIDYDKVELSNLNRSLYTRADIGKNKAKALAAIMNEHYPYSELKAVAKRVEQCSEKVLKDADVIISGLDSMLVRIWLADFAIKNKIPLIDGGLKGLQARVQVWTPGNACLACEIPPENYAEIMDLHDSCETLVDVKVPAFPTVASITAAAQANEAMKIILDKKPITGVLIIDLLAGAYNLMQLDRNPVCIVCKGT